MAPIDPDVVIRLDQIQAEVYDLRGAAERAEVRAGEAISRVADLRVCMDERLTDVDHRIDLVAAEVQAAEGRLVAVLERHELASQAERQAAGTHREAVAAHVIRLWEAAHGQRQAMGLYALAIIGAVLLRGGCGT